MPVASASSNSLPADCERNDPEPRWLVIVIVLATLGMWFVLPPSLSVISPTVLLGIVGGLLAGAVWSHRVRNYRLNNLFGYSISIVLTVFMVGALILLVNDLSIKELPDAAVNSHHALSGKRLFVSAGLLWVSNIFVFASWYWRIDAGGPNMRDLRPCHTDGDFLFPQMTLDAGKRRELGIGDWSPQFIDYLFLAFNTSTAFSPTDTAVLKPLAKCLTMLQSMISLIIIAILAGRAVNIL